VFRLSIVAQTTSDSTFKLALADHPGQLQWSTDGFKIIQSSAKPTGREIGIRGKDRSGRLSFLGFLFLVPEQATPTSAKYRDGALEPQKKSNKTLKILDVRNYSVQQSAYFSCDLYNGGAWWRDGLHGARLRSHW
jgi:hypothetical protein